MNTIIESYEHLEQLSVYSSERCFISLIADNDRYHPKLTHVVAIYLHPKSEKKGFIIGIDHTECQNLVYERVIELLSTFKYLYTISKKETLYHANRLVLTDISLLASLLDGRKLDIRSPIHTIDLFYRYQAGYKTINSIVPILKLYEREEHIYNSVKSYLNVEIPPYFDFYNKLATGVFYLIEQQGIGVTKSILDCYSLDNPQYSIAKSKVYGSYNLYNVTTRPTNSFNSINFTAIPKEGQYRESFSSINDYFVQFDFDGYHLRLLCYLIGYPLTDEPAHAQLAKLYFKTDEISELQYKKAKEINFAVMYGSIPKEYADYEVFKLLRDYTNKLWKEYTDKGFITDPISKREIRPEKSSMNGPKLLNYLIQSLETSRNVLVLKKLISYLNNKKSKVVLYIYDAIVIDFSKEDTKQTLEDIEVILSENGKYPVKMSYNKTLSL